MSIPSGPGGMFPLPNSWLEDNSYEPNLNDAMRKVRENFEKTQLAIGSNANTTAATSMSGLYAGTWGDYTGTAGYLPSYSKTLGLVVLEGHVVNPTFTPGTILTLPAGYRPATNTQFLCLGVGGSPGVQTIGPVAVEVSSSGAVSFGTGMTGGGLTNNMYYISLGGIVFKAAS